MRAVVEDQLLWAGSNYVVWDGKDGTGEVVPDGLYSYTIDAVDEAGNAAGTQGGDVLVDTRKPMVLESPEAGSTLAGRAPHVNRYASAPTASPRPVA